MGFDARLFHFRSIKDETPLLIDDRFGVLLVGVNNGGVDIDELTDDERSKLSEIGELACSKQFRSALNDYNGTPNVPLVTRVRYKDIMNEDLADTPLPPPQG